MSSTRRCISTWQRPGFEHFSHRSSHQGWINKGTKKVPVTKLDDLAKKHGYRKGKSFVDFTKTHVTTYSKTVGPFQDSHLAVHSKDGKNAWHVETSHAHDKS